MSIDHLSQVNIFKDFTSSELYPILEMGSSLLIKGGSYIVIEGEITRGLYLLLTGRASIYKTDPRTKNMVRLADIEAPTHFGEFSLIDETPRSASIQAEVDCSLIFFEATAFHNYLNRAGEATQLKFFRGCAFDLVMRMKNINNDYLFAQHQIWTHVLSKHKNEGAERFVPPMAK